MNEEELATWRMAVKMTFEVSGPGNITLGLIASEHAEDCDALETGGDCECEQTTFSSTPCSICGSRLGGSRNAVTFWADEEEPELEPWPPAPEYAYLVGKYAEINGTPLCYVVSADVDDNGDETVTVKKDGRTYTLIASTIYSVSA